ncbi:NAD-dependent malic enzyme [Candidatus Woesearchaeota archaeon]|nr:NAD-dependent malic enzyme [Candidatus Woesearchaeota archaeon]
MGVSATGSTPDARKKIQDESLQLHVNTRGKVSIQSKMPLANKHDLSLAYTPGVAEPCRMIAKNKDDVYKYTFKGNSVAVVSDGSAVLGLGNIGPEAGLPVMEGKAVLFKEFADIDAFPICLATQDSDEIVAAVKAIAPTFGGINLEDIAAPRCFEIEERLKRELDIPVFHDDQHGTAIVVLAALSNALKVVKKPIGDVKMVMSGAGAAGIATMRMLLSAGAKNIILCDKQGIIYKGRKENMNEAKHDAARRTNSAMLKGDLGAALRGADVFIGMSGANLLTAEMVKTMNKDAIVFAMANPDPEILPGDAKAGGAKVIATGRSDFPNQVNNVLAFPGVFRGALDVRASQINEEMKMAAVQALAACVKNPTAELIIPDPFDKSVAQKVSKAVKEAAVKSGVARAKL